MAAANLPRWFRRLFNKGARPDIQPELSADGEFTDALNMRPSSVTGNTGAMKSVDGETLLWDAPDFLNVDPTTYICIGATTGNGYALSFWCSTLFDYATDANPPILTANGTVVAMSRNIPYIFDRPLQIGTELNCGDRILIAYPADHNSDPLWWDVRDMLDQLALGDGLYFENYTTEYNSVSLNAPPSIPWPTFPQCVFDLGSAIGLQAGTVSYAIQYETANGDVTAISPYTGQIPIPALIGNTGENHNRTNGAPPGTDIAVTRYGTRICFRTYNIAGFAAARIIRQSFRSGDGLVGVGVVEYIGRIPLEYGQDGLVYFNDPADANIVPALTVAVDESVQQLVGFHKPKGVDVANSRLEYANVELDPKNFDLQYGTFPGGNKTTAITKKLSRVIGGQEQADGYENPYNCAVNKSAFRGGRVKIGIEYWNGSYGKYPTVNVPEPFEVGSNDIPLPQRRDIKGDNPPLSGNKNWGLESLTLSDDQIEAANVDVASQTAAGPVSPTFETFSTGTKRKSDTFNIVNIQPATSTGTGSPAFDYGLPADPSESGHVTGRPGSSFAMSGQPQPPGITSVSGNASGWEVPNGDAANAPWRPYSNLDANTSGYNIPPNTARMIDGEADNLGDFDSFGSIPAGWISQFNAGGQCFEPIHHALGIAMKGVTGGHPAGARIMSVVYNGDTRGEIVAQGFGSWDLAGPSNYGTPLVHPPPKSGGTLRTWFPDVQSGVVDQATWGDVVQNPGNYKVRMVSPVPFYAENYGYFAKRPGATGTDPDQQRNDGVFCVATAIDTMCFTHFLRDEGQVNVGVEQPEGYQPTGGTGNFIGFDKWRYGGPMVGTGSGDNYSYWQQLANDFMQGQGGNALFDLSNITQVVNNRAEYWNLSVLQYIYAPGALSVRQGDVDYLDFNDPVVKKFQQPWYALNIVRPGYVIPDANIQPYKATSMHIALDSVLGKYTGGVMDFPLIGPREREDAIGLVPTDNRYVWIQDRRWLCGTNNLAVGTASVPVIMADIIANGFWNGPDGPVYGLYEGLVDVDGNAFLRFGTFSVLPPKGKTIHLRYDPNATMRVFGFDATASIVAHSVRDSASDGNDWMDPNQQQFLNFQGEEALSGLPFPHPGWMSNPRWFVPRSGNNTEQAIMLRPYALRQWCISWTAEAREMPPMRLNLPSVLDPAFINDRSSFFPATHYIAKPYMSGSDAVLLPSFYSSYPHELDIRKFGGLRFANDTNLDYARLPDIAFFGQPRDGTIFPIDLCTAILASLPYDPTLPGNPGQRTFLYSNMKVLSQENGEIKLIATKSGGEVGGQNQYVWFQNGVGIIPTNKAVLSGASGENVATYAVSEYWGREYRISRTIGLPDQLWRLWSRGMLPSGAGDAFYWPDRNGFYTLVGDGIRDITRNEYLSKLRELLVTLPTGYVPHATAFYNPLQQEVWNSTDAIVGTNLPAALHVYSPQNKWLGQFSYRFDEFTMTPEGVLGMRDLQTWRVDQAGQSLINGALRINWVDVPTMGDFGQFKEAVEYSVKGSKPDYMQLFDENGVLMSDQNEAAQEAFQAGSGFLWVKNYNGWNGQWWRVSTAYNPARPRAQGTLFFVRVGWNTAGSKDITALDMKFQNIQNIR